MLMWYSQNGTNAELGAAMFVYYDYKECVADSRESSFSAFRFKRAMTFDLLTSLTGAARRSARVCHHDLNVSKTSGRKISMAQVCLSVLNQIT